MEIFMTETTNYSKRTDYRFSCLTPDQKVWLISYSGGKRVHELNQNLLTYSAIDKGFDVIINYRREHIDSEFMHENAYILDQPRLNGYALWRPYFFKKTMEMMNENDILFYIDASAFIKSNLDDLICQTNNYSFLYIS